MTNAQPEIQTRQEVLGPEEARWLRSQFAAVASQIDSIWGDDLGVPEFTWDTLSAMPSWGLCEPRKLKRLALLTGALYAASALRVCLDPEPLLRMRKMLGARALDLVLSIPDLPLNTPSWPAGTGKKGVAIYVWSSAMLLAAVKDGRVRATLARALGLSGTDFSTVEPVDAELATYMVARAVEVAEVLDAEAPMTADEAAR